MKKTSEIPRLQIEYMALSELKVNEKNVKNHSNKQLDAICNSIEEFGFLVPILVDEDGVILAGHGRYQASMRMFVDEVPTVCVSTLNENQKLAFMLLDNRLGELGGGWDADGLGKVLDEVDTGAIEKIDWDFVVSDWLPVSEDGIDEMLSGVYADDSDGVGENELRGERVKMDGQCCPKCGFEW